MAKDEKVKETKEAQGADGNITDVTGRGTEKQKRTIAAMNAAPKVDVTYPLMDGQPDEMVVCVNAVRWIIKAGATTTVPKPIADIFNERMAAEGRMKRTAEAIANKLVAEGII